MPGRNVQTFLLEPSGLKQIRLRRYTRDGGECGCSDNHGYHQEIVMAVPQIEETDDMGGCDVGPGETRYGISFDDPRWPTHCRCGYRFDESVDRQLFMESLWRVQGTDTFVTLRNAKPGAMWYASWHADIPRWHGPDGKSLFCKLPNGWDWHIDSQASNCTRPGDASHKCWIRHGVPPNITVDKHGETCAAGAGSIMGGDWHGFLRNGFLEEC